MLDTTQFTYKVVYMPSEQAFFAMCDQFMHLTAMAPSYEQAMNEIQHKVLLDQSPS